MKKLNRAARAASFLVQFLGGHALYEGDHKDEGGDHE